MLDERVPVFTKIRFLVGRFKTVLISYTKYNETARGCSFQNLDICLWSCVERLMFREILSEQNRKIGWGLQEDIS